MDNLTSGRPLVNISSTCPEYDVQIGLTLLSVICHVDPATSCPLWLNVICEFTLSPCYADSIINIILLSYTHF